MSDRQKEERAAAVADTGLFVTVLASGRYGEATDMYDEARALGRRLAEAGLPVMTGGGRGLMEAVNRGARDAGGRSFGCRVAIRPGETREPESPYLDVCEECETLGARKERLLRAAALVALPGGFGTLDEVFEALALMQRQPGRKEPLAQGGGHLPPRIILYPPPFWQPLVGWVTGTLAREEVIDRGDLGRVSVAETLDAVLVAVHEDVAARVALTKRA